MARSQFRRSLRFENLEARQLLSTAGPTDQEQYMLQLLNEARTDPAAVAAQITSAANLTPDVLATLKYYNVNLQQVEQTIANATPQAPLAWNQDLASAAQGQSQYEADTQTQTHTGADGSTTRAADRGRRLHEPHVQWRKHVRLCFIGHGSDAGVFDGLGRTQRRPPHQYPAAGVSRLKMRTPVSALAIVQTSASNPSFGPMVITQDFGSQANTQAQVVGVAYNDTAGTGFYLPGEGRGRRSDRRCQPSDRRRQLHTDLGFGRLRALAGPRPVPHHRQPK